MSGKSEKIPADTQLAREEEESTEATERRGSIQHYTETFREEAVKRAMESDQPISHTAKTLGVNKFTLYTWVKDRSQSQARTDNHQERIAMLRELEELRKQADRLNQERDILKKAAAIFAAQNISDR